MNAHRIEHATDYAGRVLARGDYVVPAPDASNGYIGRPLPIVELTRAHNGYEYATMRTPTGEITIETNDLSLYVMSSLMDELLGAA